MSEPLLEVADLRVAFGSEAGRVDAVSGLGFTVGRGETVAIVGESGSGKSASALAIMGLLPESALVTGSARLNGRELIGVDDDDLSEIRGNEIARACARLTDCGALYAWGKPTSTVRKSITANYVHDLVPNWEGAVGGAPKLVVGLYLDPPERAVVLCVDEKTQIQALNRTAPVFPMLPGTPARASHDYVRHGTSSLYAALDLATGQVIGSLHARHRSQEFLAFLKKIDAEVPADLDCHVVLDNASTHKTPAVKRWLTNHPRFVLHFTPTSSSWLNLVERWIAELTTKKLRRGTHTSVRQLNADIRAWIQHWNNNPRPYVWTKTADQILANIANYCTRINDSGH